MAQGMQVRLAGALLVGGMVATFVATAFHPSREDPNDHPAVFAEYAADASWKLVHFMQFAGGLVIIAGLIVLYRALMRTGVVETMARLAVAGAVATAAAVAILQAVDGVALKEAVDAWASAAPAKKGAAFREAETVRWLEWAVNSYFRLLEGVTLGLYGLAIARSAIVPRWLGWVGLVAGLGYIAIGAIVAYEGFTDAALVLGTAMDLLFFVVAAGIAFTGWRAHRDSELRAT